MSVQDTANAILAKWGAGGAPGGGAPAAAPPTDEHQATANAIAAKWGASPPAAKREQQPSTYQKLTASYDPGAEEFGERHPVLGPAVRAASSIGGTILGAPQGIYDTLAHPVKSAQEAKRQAETLLDTDEEGPLGNDAREWIGRAVTNVGRNLYRGYEGGVLPEALGSGAGNAIAGELTGELGRRAAGAARPALESMRRTATGSALERIPFTKTSIATKAAPRLEAAGNEARGMIGNALDEYQRRMQAKLPTKYQLAEKQVNAMQDLRNRLSPLTEEKNSTALFSKYAKQTPEMRNALSVLEKEGLIDRGRLNTLSRAAAKIAKSQEGGYLPWMKRYAIGVAPLELAQRLGIGPKLGMGTYAVGYLGATALDMAAKRAGALRAIGRLPELGDAIGPDLGMEEPLAASPKSPVPPSRSITGMKALPLSDREILRMNVPLGMQALPNERPFEDMLAQVEHETGGNPGAAELEGKLARELRGHSQKALERARVEEATREIVPWEGGFGSIAPLEREEPEGIRGSLGKPSGRLVLSPEEARAAERMQQIAQQRAHEHGMQYAAGMRPEAGGRVPFTPTRTITEEYPPPREVLRESELGKRLIRRYKALRAAKPEPSR